MSNGGGGGGGSLHDCDEPNCVQHHSLQSYTRKFPKQVASQGPTCHFLVCLCNHLHLRAGATGRQVPSQTPFNVIMQLLKEETMRNNEMEKERRKGKEKGRKDERERRREGGKM